MNISAESQSPSSAVEYRRLKRNLVLLGLGWNVGLMDVETGVVSGLVDKLVCSFNLAADVVWGEIR